MLSLQLLDSILLFDNFTLETTQSCIQTRLNLENGFDSPNKQKWSKMIFVCTFIQWNESNKMIQSYVLPLIRNK